MSCTHAGRQYSGASAMAAPSLHRAPCRGDASVRAGGTNLASRKGAELMRNTVRRNMAAVVDSPGQGLWRTGARQRRTVAREVGVVHAV